jgi:hypothetical protein
MKKRKKAYNIDAKISKGSFLQFPSLVGHKRCSSSLIIFLFIWQSRIYQWILLPVLGYTTFMTWQAITEEESVPAVKPGDTLVSFSPLLLKIHQHYGVEIYMRQ